MYAAYCPGSLPRLRRPGGIHKVKHLDEVPDHVPPSHVMGKLKSWARYTKKERMNAIDSLVAEMHQSGVTSKKFDEILTGLEG